MDCCFLLAETKKKPNCVKANLNEEGISNVKWESKEAKFHKGCWHLTGQKRKKKKDIYIGYKRSTLGINWASITYKLGIITTRIASS